MKKNNLIATLAIIALSATTVVALELDNDAMNKMTPEIKATLEQGVNAQTRNLPELPDYESLNKAFIYKLERRAGEAAAPYVKKYEEEHGPITLPSEGNSVEIQDILPEGLHFTADYVLRDYKDLLDVLNTTRRYNEKNKKKIQDIIYQLDDDVAYMPLEFADYLCKQDRYFLKAEDAVVNLSFLIKNYEINGAGYYLLSCLKEQEPVKIKVHSFNRAVYNLVH